MNVENSGVAAAKSYQSIERTGGGNAAFAAIGLVVRLDVGKAVEVVNHHAEGLLQALLREIGAPIDPLDPRTIGEMEMRHGIEGAAPRRLLGKEIARRKPRERRPERLGQPLVPRPIRPRQQSRERGSAIDLQQGPLLARGEEGVALFGKPPLEPAAEAWHR